MLAYAANAPQTAGRAGSPKALVLIVAGHAALLTAVMTAKLDIGRIIPADPTILIDIPADPPPPPPTPTVEHRTTEPATQPSFIDTRSAIADMDTTGLFDHGAAIEDIATVIGTDVKLPQLDPPIHEPVMVAARLAIADSALKPPYPLDKRRLGEEASLRLRLTIDTRGRVTAVEPIGKADPSFLEAARRHILRVWRYKPATEDGIAVGSSTVISLAFRLEEV